MSIIKNNSEILFLYDAKMCNPNGDPDDENRPRFDHDRERCLVSDVRLKRYIRDYLEEKGYDIYVTKSEGVVQAEDRIRKVLGRAEKEKVGLEDLPELLERLIDVRLFGATMPIKGERRGEGQSVSLTGPVQFSWGYSLNKAQFVDSVSITSQFSTREGAGQGTFGKDYRIYYALIGFHGVVSARRAEAMKNLLEGSENVVATTEEDIKLLDESLVKSIPLAATRSKIGQYPRLYMRVVFVDSETFMGDLREYLILKYEVKSDTELRSVNELCLDLTKIKDRISKYKDKISKVVVYQDEDLCCELEDKKVLVKEMLENILGTEKVETIERI